MPNQYKPRHGHARKATRTRTHRIWSGMIARCRYPSWYTFRGIRVCDRWQTYENFLADMGEAPEGKSIDRIDNDGDYCPENCRWATDTEQMNNRGCNVHLTIGGVTKTLSQWARETGIPKTTISQRIKRGWPADRILRKTSAREKMVTIGGVTKSITQWSSESGVSFWALAHRVENGWPEERLLEPHGCRGSTRFERETITIGGVTHSVAEWSKLTGLSTIILDRRVKAGWPEERLLDPPRRGGHWTRE